MITAQHVQDPVPPATLIQELQALGWVDHTALAVLLVFFVLGLFKGLIWQVSRIGILVAAYVVAGRFGHEVAAMLSSGPPAGAAANDPAAAAAPPGETTLYLAYVLLFLAVLVVLSLVAMIVKRLADKAGLGFFDRLGGGLLGIATGACVVLAMVFVVHMFFRDSALARAAESSHSLRWSQRAIDWLGTAVNDDLRSVLALVPLKTREPAPGAPGDGPEPGVAPVPGAPAPDQPKAVPPEGPAARDTPAPDAVPGGAVVPAPPPVAPPLPPAGGRGGHR